MAGLVTPGPAAETPLVAKLAGWTCMVIGCPFHKDKAKQGSVFVVFEKPAQLIWHLIKDHGMNLLSLFHKDLKSLRYTPTKVTLVYAQNYDTAPALDPRLREAIACLPCIMKQPVQCSLWKNVLENVMGIRVRHVWPEVDCVFLHEVGKKMQ